MWVKKRKKMIVFIVVLSLIGLAISLYGMMVERKVTNNMQYKAACDISDAVSCTKTFTSPYNKMLGISNVRASALYYCAMLVLALVDSNTGVMILSCIGLCVTVCFAYILYFKIRTLCLICTS